MRRFWRWFNRVQNSTPWVFLVVQATLWVCVLPSENNTLAWRFLRWAVTLNAGVMLGQWSSRYMGHKET